MMDDSIQKEQFSHAFVRAVASAGPSLRVLAFPQGSP
jgi:hypothetical protein